MPDVLRVVVESYGWSTERVRAPIPSADDISRMDAAFAWLALVPQSQYVLRRIVAARALVDPLTGSHVCNWSRLARAIGADYRAVKRWHGQGIAAITAALARG